MKTVDFGLTGGFYCQDPGILPFKPGTPGLQSTKYVFMLGKLVLTKKRASIFTDCSYLDNVIKHI